jgi:predicted transcriptional regulator
VLFRSDNDFILEILKNVTNQQQKLSLLVKKCNESTYNYSFIKSGLELLGGDYALIALQQGHRRKFKATKDNKELAIYLEDNEFISSQKEKDGMIIMNAKKIEK